MGSTMHMHNTHADSEVLPFDMGYGQDQRFLLARAGSDPTFGFDPNMSSESQSISLFSSHLLSPQSVRQNFQVCHV